MRHLSPFARSVVAASAALQYLFAFLLVSVGILPVSINSSADGAVSKHQLEDMRQSRVQFNLDRCDIAVPPSADTRRDFEVDGVSTDLIIATSHRPYHMIVSYVLQIVLRECKNIGRVVVRPLDPSINQFDQSAVLAKIRSKEIDRIPDSPNGRFPESMINMEVWRDVGYGAGYGFSNLHSVHYAGSLATQGLFGWWIPRVWMNRQPNDDNIPWDHYIILTMKEKVKSLSIPAADLEPLIFDDFSCESLKRDASLRRRLRNWKCDGKVLQSPACAKDSSVACATLLAGDPFQRLGRGTLSELLSLQIEGVPGGLVNLAFLGSNLDAYVLRRLNVTVSAMKGTLFFNWAPNALTTCDAPGAEILTLDTPFEASSKPKYRLSCVSGMSF